MTSRLISLLGLASVVCAGASCSSADDETTAPPIPPPNQDPQIESLTVDREAVRTGGTAILTIVASDPDDDELTYTWAVSNGALSGNEGADDKVWTAPAERGTATVTVTVDDGRGGTIDDSVDIDIKAWALSNDGVQGGPSFKDVEFLNKTEGWVTGGGEDDNTPYIYHYTNGTWVDETAGSDAHMHAVSVLAADDIWVAGGMGAGFHFDGTDWNAIQIMGGCVHAMSFVSPDHGWVTPAHAAQTAGIRHYSGGSWASETTPDHNGIDGIDMVSETDGWAVGGGGLIFRYDGTGWAEAASPVTAGLHAVRMLSATDGFIGGSAGTILRYDGSAWTEMATPVSSTIWALAAVDENNVWAVGSLGTILFFDGVEWVEVESPTESYLYGIDMIDGSEGWMVGDDGTILHFE